MVDSLSPETLRRVLKHYFLDFALFGYKPETVLSDKSPSMDNVRETFKRMLSGI